MSTLVSKLDVTAPSASPRGLPSLYSIGVWLVATLITVFFALLLRDSAVIEGVYLPRTNDSLYHARRILDAAVGAAGSTSSTSACTRPTAPGFRGRGRTTICWRSSRRSRCGSRRLWIRWRSSPTRRSRGSSSTRRCSWRSPRTIGLSSRVPPARDAVFRIVAANSVPARDRHDRSPLRRAHVRPRNDMARSALVQASRDVRREPWLWERRWASHARFTTGCSYCSSCRSLPCSCSGCGNAAPPRAALRGFAIALLVTTQLILLPSEPYRRLMFEFGLSVLVSLLRCGCTAPRSASWRGARSRAQLRAARSPVRLARAAARPHSSSPAPGFLSGAFSILDQIVEVRSPYTLFTANVGPGETAATTAGCCLRRRCCLRSMRYRVFREREPARLYYAVAATFGLALLLDQFRLHYFGFFAMVTGGLLLLDDLARALALASWGMTFRRGVRGHRSRVSAGAARTVVRVPRTGQRPRVREHSALFTSSSRGSAPRIRASCSRAPTTATACCSIATAASSPTTSFSGPRMRATSTRSSRLMQLNPPRYGDNGPT